MYYAHRYKMRQGESGNWLEVGRNALIPPSLRAQRAGHLGGLGAQRLGGAG
jgi:hypothetical protein